MDQQISKSANVGVAAARERALGEWFAAWSGTAVPELRSVSGDASFRRYFRVKTPPLTQGATGTGIGSADSGELSEFVLCDAPPDTEKNHEFAAVARILSAAGVRVPTIVHADVERGFFVLEDLGDQLLLPLLTEQSVATLYQQALHILVKLGQADCSSYPLADYDYNSLAREMSLCPNWFFEGLLDIKSDATSRSVFAAVQRALCERALDQATVLVHRDFHARNLMRLADGSLATIDFQDAVRGPATYDAVSLLRDCYIRWPDARVLSWARDYREAMLASGVALPGEDEFLCDFDWMGLQRHIKVLGIFSRLNLRDAKPGYLKDLPRVIGYVLDVLARYPGDPALANFLQWFEERALPRVQAQPWYGERG